MKRIIKADTDILRLKERIAKDKADLDFMKDLPTYGWSQMEDDWQVIETLEWKARDILRSKYNIDVYTFGSAYVYVFDANDEELQEEKVKHTSTIRNAPATKKWIKISLSDYEELELKLVEDSNSDEDYLHNYIDKIVELYNNSTFGSVVNIKRAVKSIKASAFFKDDVDTIIEALSDISTNLDRIQELDTCQNNAELMNELGEAIGYVDNCIDICENKLSNK